MVKLKSLKTFIFYGKFIESNFIIYELILISDDPINKEIDKYGLEKPAKIKIIYEIYLYPFFFQKIILKNLIT